MSASPGFSVLEGNGDGTFQGTLRILLGQGNFSTTSTNVEFATADLNGDGLTDVIGIDATRNLVSALGRGDGTFSSAYTSPVVLSGALPREISTEMGKSTW